MILFKTSEYLYEYYCLPARSESLSTQQTLMAHLHQVGSTCFNEVPDYQCFASLDSKVIVLVRDATGKAVAFASGILFEPHDGPRLLHLGLVCIAPEHRKSGLMVTLYLLLNVKTYESQFQGQRMWVTNCSAELSILKSVGRFFSEVTPSPLRQFEATPEQRQIAQVMSTRYRSQLWIGESVPFDPESFTFQGSTAGTEFGKCANRYELGTEELFYAQALDFVRGDEMLQVGYWEGTTWEMIVKTLYKRFLRQCVEQHQELEVFS